VGRGHPGKSRIIFSYSNGRMAKLEPKTLTIILAGYLFCLETAAKYEQPHSGFMKAVTNLMNIHQHHCFSNNL
jgi:hypothetical protein